jgi:hypothetical protein
MSDMKVNYISNLELVMQRNSRRSEYDKKIVRLEKKDKFLGHLANLLEMGSSDEREFLKNKNEVDKLDIKKYLQFVQTNSALVGSIAILITILEE